jgi:hypothetical protein
MFDRQVSEKRDVRAGLDIDAFKSLMARQIGWLSWAALTLFVMNLATKARVKSGKRTRSGLWKRELVVAAELVFVCQT